MSPILEYNFSIGNTHFNYMDNQLKKYNTSQKDYSTDDSINSKPYIFAFEVMLSKYYIRNLTIFEILKP